MKEEAVRNVKDLGEVSESMSKLERLRVSVPASEASPVTERRSILWLD